MAKWENRLELLQSEASAFENLINELKKETLSENVRRQKEEEAKDRAEKLQWQIDGLRWNKLIDEKLEAAIDRAQGLLDTYAELSKLQDSIWDKKETTNLPTSTGAESQEAKSEKEEKWFFWKTWDWVSEKWSAIPGRWKLAWWIVVWTITWTWIYKKLFWKKEDEKENGWWSWDKNKDDNSKEKKEKKEGNKEASRWKKFLIWAWITVWTTIWGVELYKHWNKVSSWVKEKLWLALPFDEAMQKVEAEVRNWKIDDDHFWAFNAHFDWITYDENTQEICSYWQKTKIDKSGKKLDDLSIEFPSREEMIHAANIVNFAKRMLRWKWASEKPFDKTDWWWDLSFTCSDSWKQEFLGMNNSNERSWILGTLWVTWWWILWAYCANVHWAAIWAVWGWAGWYALWAYIDNSSSAWRCCWTIARWKNFDLFKNYLNRQTDENWKSLWVQWDEVYESDDKTPMHEYLNKVKKEIDESYGDEDSTRRNLRIEQNEWNPKEYIISSYEHKLKLTLEWWPSKWEKIDFNKIKKIHIEKYEEYDSRWDWLDIDFPHTEEWIKEAIRVANLTNKIVEDWKWKWAEAYPFAYGKYISRGNGMSFNLDIDVPGMWSNWQWWTCVIWNSMLKDRFPSLYKDLDDSRTLFLKGIPSQEDWHNQAVSDKSEWSQYIKFLHQIGKWRFWKKVW